MNRACQFSSGHGTGPGPHEYYHHRTGDCSLSTTRRRLEYHLPLAVVPSIVYTTSSLAAEINEQGQPGIPAVRRSKLNDIISEDGDSFMCSGCLIPIDAGAEHVGTMIDSGTDRHLRVSV